MAACARCGALPDPGATSCPSCGAAHLTLPLGSEGESPVRSGTLVLGSGVSITDPLPKSQRIRPAAPRPREPEAHPHQARVPRDHPLAQRRAVPRVEVLDAPPAPKPRRISARTAALGALALACLLAAGAALTLISFRAPSLRAETRFDATGAPMLHVTCPDCVDGTILALGEQTLTLTRGPGAFRMEPPLVLGVRPTQIEIRAPGKRPKLETVNVVVDFIVSADRRGLTHPDPKLAVVFDAKSDVSIIVDGRVLDPGASGVRRYDLPLRNDVIGPAKSAVTLSKQIPYLVKRAGGDSLRGEIQLTVDVVPLWVEVPGESIVIETSSFMLAGSTERNGMVTVEGRPITVDPSGRFAQLMSVSAIGDTSIKVRASAPGRAPRSQPIRVRRVASLATEAAAFERSAQRSFDAIADDVDRKLGWAVVLEGKVAGLESDGYLTLLTLDVTQGCAKPPCLAQLRLGERRGLSPGQSLIAYGFLVGKRHDAASGRDLPQVRVEFLRGRE